MLLRKARRAMLGNKRSYLACIFLIAVGVMMLTALTIAVNGLEGSTLAFYRENRLADVYADVEAMPAGYADILAGLDGIAAAEARRVTEFRVEVPGAENAVTLRLIATDPGTTAPLNDLLVTGGDGHGAGEILVNPAFFEAHGLRPGDVLSILSRGREYAFTLAGTAISPEYVYITKDFSQILPDEAGFGIGYVTAESMELLTGQRGTANSIVMALRDGVVFDDVKLALEDELGRFGLSALYDKKDLLSYFFLDMEISSIHAMATTMPMVFLMLAVVVLYLMLKRVIEQERTQIGTLKAFGYSNRQLMAHYLSYGAVTGLLGGALGWGLGYLASGAYLRMFLQFFMLPQLAGGFEPLSLLWAMAAAVGSGLLGAFAGAYKIMQLQPAEAMRAEAPKSVRFDLAKRLGVLRRLFTSRGVMAIRSMTRSPLRSLFVVISIMFSFGIISLIGSMSGMIDKMIFSQLEVIERYQVKLSLRQPLPYGRAVESAYNFENVTLAEGLLELPVSLSHRHLTENVVVTAMAEDSALYRIADTNTRQVYAPPEGGFILSNGLAADLGVRAGDVVTLSSPMLAEDVPVPVSRVIEQNLGAGCYAELSFLSALMEHPDMANAVILNTDDLDALREDVKYSDMVLALVDKDSTLRGYQSMLGMFSSLYVVIEVLGTMVAFAIIYNTTTISLSERKREYATLRVLGLTVNEVSEILSFEYAVLAFFGMLLGIPFTKLLNDSINYLVDTSLFSMPSTLPLSAYLIGAGCCAAAMFLASRSARKKIRTFDMVEVLKERE